MKRRCVALLVTFAGMLAVTCSVADEGSEEEDEQSSLEESTAAAERVSSSLNAIRAHVEASSAQFYADCLRVIPSRSICTCLSDNTPVDVTFKAYLSLTYQENWLLEGIDNISQDQQAVFRATMAARDKCSE